VEGGGGGGGGGGMCKEGKRNIENLLFAVEHRGIEGMNERHRAVG